VWQRRLRLEHERDVVMSERNQGYTLIELVVVMTIIGVLASIVVPTFQEVRVRAQVANAIGEIGALQQEITEFRIINNRLPMDLAEIGRDAELDPWGQPYTYLDHAVAAEADKRKDQFLVNVNTDFDLYSVGLDAATAPAFSVPAAHDDVVRANDGGFVGLARIF
jgi:general secretion pathway protein G